MKNDKLNVKLHVPFEQRSRWQSEYYGDQLILQDLYSKPTKNCFHDFSLVNNLKRPTNPSCIV